MLTKYPSRYDVVFTDNRLFFLFKLKYTGG